jgi:hypothetical protein
LVDLRTSEGYRSNTYFRFPVNDDSFDETTEYGSLRPDAKYWIVRGEKVELSTDKEDYLKAGIKLKEYEPNEISVEEAARLAVTRYRDLFRATDMELYRSIPDDLEKILVIDEWYHKDYDISDTDPVDSIEMDSAIYDESILQQSKDFIKKILSSFFDYETYTQKLQQSNLKARKSNRPGSYETWQLIARVIVTGDKDLYKPTLAPNSHWKHWPEAGTM